MKYSNFLLPFCVCLLSSARTHHIRCPPGLCTHQHLQECSHPRPVAHPSCGRFPHLALLQGPSLRSPDLHLLCRRSGSCQPHRQILLVSSVFIVPFCLLIFLGLYVHVYMYTTHLIDVCYIWKYSNRMCQSSFACHGSSTSYSYEKLFWWVFLLPDRRIAIRMALL